MLEIQQKDNMKRYIETIQKCLLFNDIEQEDLINLLTCMGAKVKTFEKEEYIVEELENLNFVDVNYATLVRITPEQSKENFSQSWVVNENKSIKFIENKVSA